ncbi:MAG: 16S rRNA (guanine(966)-N(2))-methyltransferase RsmD [Oscillospiraceae bacterium]|jgi:16S rRNA (guanine(966)-N(2))-methyltransferase RsmD|nr:16S rRNA (guanine(966)-N(2))-methyltransferase RsmD [Oscillospiraceae bacterium]
MRVISGMAKGRKLAAPAGGTTRPTADYVKENIFNIVQFDIEGASVLDLYCGSGQLGLEAISRGAAGAVFVDMSSSAIACVRQNIKTLDFGDKCRVIPGEVLQFLAGYKEGADLIFLDPPYETALTDKTLARVAEFDILRPGGIMICECSRKEQPAPLPPPYKRVKRYDYGAKSVIMYVRETD